MTALRAEPATTTDTVIAATGLRRTYGSGNDAFEAVRGVDLDVRHGEVFGRDPLRDRREVRPLCGIMLQSGGLPAELTVRETLQMWRGTCSNPTDSDSVLARVHLTDRADVRVRALSGGEQRRVDLACALIGQPRLLFLDEPTTGLDPESRRATWRLLAELKADGVTMVLTTHYLDEAEALADRIAIMHRGEIARLGTLRDIVEDHPAVIAFDDPGAALPVLPGARVSAVGSDGARRLTVETHRLQPDLHTLLDWAADRGLPLTGLQAHAPSLESVFLSVADATNGDPR